MHILHSTPMCVYSQQPSLGIFVRNILLISPKGGKGQQQQQRYSAHPLCCFSRNSNTVASSKPQLSNLQKIRLKCWGREWRKGPTSGSEERNGLMMRPKERAICCSVLKAHALSIALDLCSYISFSFRVSIAPIVSTKAGGWASERILMNFSTNHSSLFILFFCEPIFYIMIHVRALINWCACYGLWREDDVIYKGRWVSADELCHCVVTLLIFPIVYI